MNNSRLLLLFCLTTLVFTGCFTQSSNEAEYHYSIQLKNQNSDVVIDSVRVDVSSNGGQILDKLYGPSELGGGTLDVVFTADKDDVIDLNYELYSKDVMVLKKSHRFTHDKAIETPEITSLNILDPVLVDSVIKKDVVPSLDLNPRMTVDTLYVGVEYSRTILITSYNNEDIKIKFETNLKSLKIKKEVVSGTPTAEEAGFHYLNIKIHDGNGWEWDSYTWGVLILTCADNPDAAACSQGDGTVAVGGDDDDGDDDDGDDD